ncbi:hypothetical protein [Hymenobacter arizonensis]|uniref:Uncharacterized protein n=1 Tax=Hymenobacter arizonensis TaxID=1227077 RepID=A0A1I6BH60_HYMAR|nr:hypothetical protein [Hymenobacter arizonensis]SFQ80275.1 hypothetical protein SAMN04515668_4561 [Hymenobacter arizonensis]
MIATTFSKPALFVAVLLPTVWAVHKLHRRRGAAVQYYGVIGGAGLLALVVWSVPHDFLDDMPDLSYALLFEFIVLALVSFWLSIRALGNPSPIPWWIALPCALAALFFVLLIFLISIGMGSSGMVG